jgi:hypothetical protein
MLPDQYTWWRQGLNGEVIETEKGNPRSGCYRSQSGDEVFSIWRDETGLHCERSKYGDGSKMTADEIDEQFGWICRYPIPYELYELVITGEGQLPPEYKTRLTTKEIQGGIPWTPELGKRKLLADPERFDEHGNERPGAEHNNPPEDLPADRALAKRIHDLGLQLKALLDKFGGAPRTQEEAEVVSGYANKFKDFENEAVAAHKAEKAPHFEKCKEIDAKWFGPVRDKAIGSRDRIIAMIRAFEKAEDARKTEAARAANEAAQKVSAQAAIDGPAETAPQIVPEPTKVSTLRGTGKRTQEKLVTDLKAFLAYLASMDDPPGDLVDVAEKIARKLKGAGVKAPGMAAAQQKELA